MTAVCTSPEKQQYAGKAAAKRAIRSLHKTRRVGSGRIVAYPCPAGDHWHIGHMNSLDRNRRPIKTQGDR